MLHNPGLTLVLMRVWPPGFHNISCIFLFDPVYMGFFLMSIEEVTCTPQGVRLMLIFCEVLIPKALPLGFNWRTR